MTNGEVKSHPMYPMLAVALGEKQAMAAVREAIEKQRLENQATTEFSKDSKKIIIPVSMNKMQASQELERQWHDEETIIEVDRGFNYWNWKDVLVAVKKAATEHFGWVQGKTKMSFFGPQRPKDISVVVDIIDGKSITEDCFYGTFTASAWEEAEINVGPGFISAEVKKRYASDVKGFYDLIQKYLDTDSIYRGKSITVTQKTDPWGETSLDFEVFEMNISDKIFLNEDTERIVQNFMIDDLGEEGKRCFLLSGGYGNAKTETAMRIGGEGKKKGMAFFYCKDAVVFHTLLKQANNYQPCVVFLEDVDEIGAGERRDADMNRILNTLDGVQTKGNSLTVMFTTNHENRINSALRRPGRIDLVTNFGNPNKTSVAKIYQSYLGKLDAEMNVGEKAIKLNFPELAENSQDVPGAVVAEIAKRAAKLCKKRNECTEELVRSAIDSMTHHLKLMAEPVEASSTGNMTISVSGANIKTESLEIADLSS